MLLDYMKRTFAERSRKNPNYSLRAFARSLGMDSSTVSAIMNGKRPLTIKNARKIIEGLNISDPNEAQTLMVETLSIPGEKANAEYTEIAHQQAEAIASWEHFAILAVLELKDFSGLDRAISERLNIPFGIVVECLARLERLGMITKTPKGWKLTAKNLSTGGKIASAVLREGHRQNILRSLDSLENDPVEIRDVSGMTMAVSRERLEEARKMIRDFRRRISSYMEGGKRNAVYRLNIQLFPLSQEEK